MRGFDELLLELAAERARYEDLRSAGRVLEALEARSHLHELRAQIAYHGSRP